MNHLLQNPKGITISFFHDLWDQQKETKMNVLLIKFMLISLLCIGFIHSGKSQVIYTTDFGTAANINPPGWTFTGIGMNISSNTTSSGYTGASGGAYLGEGNSMTYTNTAGSTYTISQLGASAATLSLSTTGYSNIAVSFGMRKSSGSYNTNATYSFEWSTDDISYTPISYTEATAGNWGLATGSGLALPASANNQPTLYLRWSFNRTGTGSNFKIDDITVSSTTTVTPSDMTPPTVTSATLKNNAAVLVKFSEPVSVTTATTISHYTFTPALSITSISLTTAGDSATLNLSTPLTLNTTYSLSVASIADLAANTMTATQTFTLLYNGVTVKHYTWKTPQTIGSYQGKNIPNGGFSGLSYIKGTTNEFYVITDRGPNLDANANNHAITMGGSNNTAKLFALPSFHPNIIRVKAQGDSLVYLSSITIKRPDNTPTSGLINPTIAGGTGEIALTDTSGTTASPDVWGIDSEGLVFGNNNDFWVSEEYGVSIWNTDNTGKVINRYAPYGGLPGSQPQDMAIDTIFKFRNPNKGFEGVAFAPNKKVYGFLQNTLLFPASDVNLKKNTRLHRFVEIDTRTNTTRMLGYEHDAVPASGPLNSIKHDKRYIGDAIAVNDHEMLVLEHGKSSTESYGKVYLIDLAPATPINAVNHLSYASGTKSFEQLLDSVTAYNNGVTVVKKTLFLDLNANGYDPSIEKKEGLTIINDTCIAIANDNDFGIVSTNSDGVATLTTTKSMIYVFSVPRSKKLNLCNPVTVAVGSLTFCSGDSSLINTPVTSGLTYQWKNNGVSITGATTASYYAKSSGSYELYATNGNGCVAISNTKTITVSPCTSIEDLTEIQATAFQVFPNPNNGTFTIKAGSALTLSIINTLGQVITTLAVTEANQYQTTVNGLPNGLYYVTGTDVKNNRSAIQQKIVVAK